MIILQGLIQWSVSGYILGLTIKIRYLCILHMGLLYIFATLFLMRARQQASSKNQIPMGFKMDENIKVLANEMLLWRDNICH